MWLLLPSIAWADCPEVTWSTVAEAQAIVDDLEGAVDDSLAAAENLERQARAAGCFTTATHYELGACAPVMDVVVDLDTFACDLASDGVGADGWVEESTQPDSWLCGDSIPYVSARRSLDLATADGGAAVQSVSVTGESSLDYLSMFPWTRDHATYEVGWLGGVSWTVDDTRSAWDDGVSASEDEIRTWTDCDTSLTTSSYEDPTMASWSWTLETPAHTLSLGWTTDPDPFCAVRCGCAAVDQVYSVTLDGAPSSVRVADLSPATDADGDGALAEGSDCDDTRADVNPCASDDTCDGVDDDCDGTADEDVQMGFLDLDGDGYGAGAAQPRCDDTLSWSSRGDDCDDTDPAIHPEAAEVCDGLDVDCDGLDEGPGWVDADGDGYAGSWGVADCDALAAAPEDCDDSTAAVAPDQPERCNGRDDDCDGRVDAADDDVEGAQRWHPDHDGDGAGATVEVWICSRTEGLVRNADDCDDEDPLRAPDAEEVCDEVDNDCDEEVDEGAVCGEEEATDTGARVHSTDGGGKGCATAPGGASGGFGWVMAAVVAGAMGARRRRA